MNQDESWVAEQARLLTLEDGFGPVYCGVREAHTPSRRGQRRLPDYIPESGGSSNSSSQPSGDSSSSA